MNHNRKRVAVEKYTALASQMTPEELDAAIAADEKGYDIAERQEILVTAMGAAHATPPPAKEEEKKPEEKKPDEPKELSQGERLGLDRFDYSNLTGKNFEEYVAFLKSRPMHQLFDFQCVKAKAVKLALYPGMPQSPVKLDGIKITEIEPINEPRMEARHALELNAQVENSGRYYLLKK